MFDSIYSRRAAKTRHEIGQEPVEERNKTTSVVSVGVRPFGSEQDPGYENDHFRIKVGPENNSLLIPRNHDSRGREIHDRQAGS